MRYLTFVLLAFASGAMAADWTPYVQGMQNGCAIDIGEALIANKLPKPLSADVVRRNTSKKSDDEDETGVITLRLKNAKAFGYPLQKITYRYRDGVGHPEDSYELQFAGSGFMSLLPRFGFDVNGRRVSAGQKKMWYFQAITDKDGNCQTGNDGACLGSYRQTPYRVTKNKDGSRYHFAGNGHYSIAVSKDDGWLVQYSADKTELSFNAKKRTITCEIIYP